MWPIRMMKKGFKLGRKKKREGGSEDGKGWPNTSLPGAGRMRD